MKEFKDVGTLIRKWSNGKHVIIQVLLQFGIQSKEKLNSKQVTILVLLDILMKMMELLILLSIIMEVFV
eukprot:CAMPEP_0114657710 /NCGR_PEP_ID=MMETSP0191-20121206/14390_1 /TAXON_ID=126664 /ORGANISM="Sorites sp." /LENGTH=68 /DNA_ID=CAMNT_0001877745 /DNA_START=664 /DNA_END=870 /DNA_ORIENTATION=+